MKTAARYYYYYFHPFFIHLIANYINSAFLSLIFNFFQIKNTKLREHTRTNTDDGLCVWGNELNEENARSSCRCM